MTATTAPATTAPATTAPATTAPATTAPATTAPAARPFILPDHWNVPAAQQQLINDLARTLEWTVQARPTQVWLTGLLSACAAPKQPGDAKTTSTDAVTFDFCEPFHEEGLRRLRQHLHLPPLIGDARLNMLHLNVKTKGRGVPWTIEATYRLNATFLTLEITPAGGSRTFKLKAAGQFPVPEPRGVTLSPAQRAALQRGHYVTINLQPPQL